MSSYVVSCPYDGSIMGVYSTIEAAQTQAQICANEKAATDPALSVKSTSTLYVTVRTRVASSTYNGIELVSSVENIDCKWEVLPITT